MKKLYLLLFLFVVILSWCSQNSSNSSKNTNQKNVIKKTQAIEKNTIKDDLSAYDKAIIKMAVDKWIKFCNNLSSQKKSYCQKIVKNEQLNYKLANCGKLTYLKQKCLDNKYFKARECGKIVDEFTRRNCNLQKEFDEVIKNGDISKCNQLPYPEKQKCKKILTK